MTVIFAQQREIGEALFLVVLLAVLGYGTVRLTQRMRTLENSIIRWACGLGIATGIIAGICLAAGQTDGSLVRGLGGAILVGGLIGGLSVFPWYFVVAVIAFMFEHILAPPFRLYARYRQGALDRRALRREEKQRLRQQRDLAKAVPDRDRVAQDDAHSQHRRELARMDCELLWIAYAPAIQQRFSRQDLEAFLGKYMGDSHPPEFVEERAAALKTTITTLYTNAEPTRKYNSIEEAITGFDRAKQRIAAEHFEDPEFQEYLNLELDKIKAQHLAAVIKNMGA